VFGQGVDRPLGIELWIATTVQKNVLLYDNLSSTAGTFSGFGSHPNRTQGENTGVPTSNAAGKRRDITAAS
jgi:hypothetical protein